MLNRGAGHGVKKDQVFVVYRNGIAVGRARAARVSQTYTELRVTDNTLGIQPQDRAAAIFPEPKFEK
jgi:hypothetical protein